MAREIHVLVVEEEWLAKELVARHFNDTQITYAGIFDAEARPEIVSALDKIQANEE